MPIDAARCLQDAAETAELMRTNPTYRPDGVEHCHRMSGLDRRHAAAMRGFSRDYAILRMVGVGMGLIIATVGLGALGDGKLVLGCVALVLAALHAPLAVWCHASAKRTLATAEQSEAIAAAWEAAAATAETETIQ